MDFYPVLPQMKSTMADNYNYRSRKNNVHNISTWWALLIFGAVFLLGSISKHRLCSLPNALTANEIDSHNASFIAERAFYDLNILTSFGPRPTGTHANEILAVDFFKRELSYITDGAHANQWIQTDIQVVSGAYYIPFKPHPMNNVYRNVQNIVALVAGRDEGQLRNNTLMLNCHFDSVAGSPGASDDAASCAVMLEVLRVLSKQKHRLRHNVLFLFNGAEETPLQASHGFITQHKWANDVRAFLNLESVGSNGKEMLFQSGPNHGWLIDFYKASVPHPNGQVAAEEIFQLGLIPSDTDFRIFRDFGKVPGMDFAHNMNGYRYHTKYDHINYLSPAVLQRTGDNVLALVKKIASSDELMNTGAYANGQKVYYDVFGFFFIAYTDTFGQVFNIIVSASSIIISCWHLRIKGAHRRGLLQHNMYGVIMTLATGILSGMLACGIAYAMDYTGKAMFWYTRTYLVVLVYALPAVILGSITYTAYERSRDTPLSAGLQAQARITGVNVVWSLACLGLSIANYRSAYVLMVPSLLALLVSATNWIFQLQNSVHKWMYTHLCGQIVHVLWATYFYHSIMSVFIPISGRSGGTHNPDYIIGPMVAFFTFLVGSYLFPLVGLLRNRRFLWILFVAFVATQITFAITHIHFPYGDDPSHPTPQRHFITHAIRKVYDSNGRINYTDSGYWFRELDWNVEKTIDGLVAPEVPTRQEENVLCKKLPNCGLPSYSCRQKYTGGFWLPAAAPLLPGEAKITSPKVVSLTATVKQLSFTIEGSYLNSLHIRTVGRCELVSWNIVDAPPIPTEYNQRQEYFIMMTHGLDAPPMNITMEFNTKEPNWDGPLVEINLVTTHWTFNATPIFSELLARFPKWAFPVSSVASLQAYTF